MIFQYISYQIMKNLRPRLIFNGHTHYSCFIRHNLPSTHQKTNLDTSDEYTLSSFSCRNNRLPSFLLVSTPLI